MEHILSDSDYHYLIRPLIDTNNKNKLYSVFSNVNNELIDSWYKNDMYFKNPQITVPYLHIQKYKKDRYTLSIFSSIYAENINNKSFDTEEDKSWCILKKKMFSDELNKYLREDFLHDYKNKWLTRNHLSDKYDETDITDNFTEYWYKCIVTR